MLRVMTQGAFGWYDLEQDRTAGAHGAASCQPNGTPETEHIFVEKCVKLENVYGSPWSLCTVQRVQPKSVCT